MKKINLLIALLISIQCISQNIDQLYSNYFENTREIPYLHLNKTSFIKGEEIWFQSYVIEQNSNKLHTTTSNLYVSVFDEDGHQKEQHLIHIENGIGYGSIPIDSSFTQNNYYIKASTNWMRNFSEDNSFTQKISILSDQKNTSNKSSSQDDFYEFKLMPEGGHLLENTVNNIAVLIKNQNNKGVETKTGIIKDSNGNSIGGFNTNALGFANVNLAIKKGEIYTFEATLNNGTTLTQNTNVPKQIGVTLNTKILDDYFVLNILTNIKSLNILNGKKYRVFIHNTRSFKNIFFDFNNTDKNYVLLLKKQELFKGINIITIFNEKNQPVLERLIYNDLEDVSNQIKVTTSKIKYDSIQATVTNYSKEKIFLSSSFLPSNTKAYNPNNNIKSQILLQPYINGVIENADYYFNTSKNKSKDLDLLLLTQGWSKYNWGNIFNNPPNDNFDFENGIDITLTFKEKLSAKQSVLMFSEENNLAKEIKLNNNTYVLKNAFIKKNSKLNLSLLNNNNTIKLNPILTYSNYEISDRLNLDYIKFLDENIKTEENFNINDFMKDTEVLEEVILVGEKKYENEATGIASSFKKVDLKNTAFTRNKLIDYIEETRQAFKYDKNYLNTIYFNNKNVTNHMFSSLRNIEMSEVREIRLGTKISGIGREMHIFTYSNKEFNKINKSSTLVEVLTGYNQEKKYYLPKYPSFSNSTYKEFGAIYWKPNIVLEPDKAITFSVPKNYQKEAKIFIEGITESGQLISKNQLLNFE